MNDETKIVFILATIALVAVLIYRDKQGVPMSNESQVFSDMTKGPAYLMYNVPFAFSPPVGNFLPEITAGNGQTPVSSPLKTASCGCA